MRKKAKKKKNIKTILKSNLKLIIGIVIGITVSSGVYAATILFAGDAVSYDNTTSGLTSTNVQDALDELYASCARMQIGEYFSLTPDASTYTIPTSATGYTSAQTIAPNELTLWRIIGFNSNGEYEAVSEYLSSTDVYFAETTGFANFIGGLQTIAAQYAKSGYTTATRMMGYDGQTLTITNTSKFDGTSTSAPSSSTTPTPTSGAGQEYSNGVRGDTLYLKDYRAVQNAYEPDNNPTNYCTTGVCAYKKGTSTIADYMLASRTYFWNSATIYGFQIRYIHKTSNSSSINAKNLRLYDSSWKSYTTGYPVRPIITLKTGVSIASGNGTKDSPYVFN